MANVRCPMCSKLNPPEAEACSYCGARLKPLRSPTGSPPAGAPAGKKPGDSETPDWLSSLRSDEPAQESSAPGAPSEPGESDKEMPDWLARIRSRASSEPGDSGSEPSYLGGRSQDETPDWMKGIGGTSSSSQESGTGWLRSLSGDQSEEPPTSGHVPLFQEEEPVEPAGDDDWLNKLADWETSSGQQPPEPAPKRPAWDAAPSSTPEPAPADEDLSWLSSFAQDSSAPLAETPAEQEEHFGLTGFLSSIDQPPADQPISEEPRRTPPQERSQPPAETGGYGLTGFLSSLGGGAPEETAPKEAAPEMAAPDEAGPMEAPEGARVYDLPEWIGGEPPKAQEPLPSEAADDTSFADWLQSLEANPPAAQASEPQGEPTESGPHWLTDQPIAEIPAEPSSPEASSDLPPWLEGAEPLPPQVVKPSGEDSGLPSWLADFGESTPPAQEAGPEAPPEREPGEEQTLPSWISMESGETEEAMGAAESVSPDAGVPDWISSFEQPPAQAQAEAEGTAQQAAPEQAAPEQFASAGDVPEWLRDFDTQSGSSVSMPPLIESEGPLVPSPAIEGDQPFAVDLPDWLAEDSAPRSAEGAEQPAEPVGEELAQADLPEWVKEMRPIESIIPGEAQMTEVDRHTEKSGPLAGMNGILPAEELATQYRKPPVYSVKLRVTEKQRNQASQLDTILAQETQPLLIPPQAKRAQGLLLRILIALLILAVLAVPPLLGLNPLAMPMLSPGENEQMFDQIENGQIDGEPVLLAVDFEPAFYGEMKLAALPVIDHLMARNARIVIVSTRPAGPALAEQLLAEASASRSGFDVSQQAINLGYLPGDMISLLEFARQPAFAAPATLSGELAWDKPILQGVGSMQDFAQVIVITDTAETGRSWVEQVQPLMGETPLMMVTSAQAGPMMAPFVESDQIDGMVSGLLGGVMYAQRSQQDTPASSYLASYQIGTLLAFGLTLVGGVVSGGMALLKRQDKDED